MKAFITSIDEPTTELCKWSLERNGFDVVVIKDNRTLAEKLKDIYFQVEEDFIRVDADVIPNSVLKVQNLNSDIDIWWQQFKTYDWYKQDLTNGGIQYIKRQAIHYLRKNIDDHLEQDRPESQMYRLPEFHNPRRCITSNKVMGVHGYAQENIKRVKETKDRRKQLYDWELYERIIEL